MEMGGMTFPATTMRGEERKHPPLPPVPPPRHRLRQATTGTVAELAQKFLEENVRNCIKPRIFPMESTSYVERVPTPFVFSSEFLGRSRLSVLGKARVLGFNNSPSSSSTFTEKEKFHNNNLALGTAEESLAAANNTFARAQHHSSRLELDVDEFSQRRGILTSSSCSNSRFSSAVPQFSLMMSSPARRSSTSGTQGGSSSRSDFASALKKWSAPIPPVLLRKLGRVPDSPLGKVKVMLRVCDSPEDASGILGVDPRRKQVTLVDPAGNNGSGITPEERRVGVSAPKMFAFDSIFGDDDDQAEICAASAAELVASVVGGEDGCFVSLGSSSTGKKQTMFGKPANQKMGVLPSTISWLFKSIQEQKQRTGSRFSVRISALTVTGGSGHEVINDLLLPFVNDGDQPPGAYLADGTQHNGGSKTNNHSSAPPILNTVSEVRAPTPETAGFFLDTALEAMSKEDPIRHFVFTLHVYQYTLDKNGKGVVGGRSRLHCVKLGNGSPSMTVLGGLLLAVLNGQRHLPSRDSKLGAILRECLGSLTCRAVVMIHVSNAHARYAETYAALQLGSRVHRLRRSRRLKMGSVGSGTGSGGSSGGSGEEMRNGTPCLGLNNHVGLSNGSSIGTIGEGETGSSDIDPSSSEQSCDTVIYLGPSIDDATDGEHPPVYLPSLDTDAGCDPKLVPSKCPLTGTGLPPKTKSPKPKSSSTSNNHHHKADGSYNTTKNEEQWVDGPKKLAKYHHQIPSTNGHANTNGVSSPSSQKNKGETWIDGPAASRVNQGNNFPSPKKSISRREPVPLIQHPPISSVKAQMIQQWISNQTHSVPFMEDFHFSDSGSSNSASAISNFLGQNGFSYHHSSNSAQAPTGYGLQHGHPSPNRNCNGQGNGVMLPEPEYKTLTVFKTCDGYDEEEGCDGNGFEFEFIEVIEPEVPVPTCDACFQVTEEDIALSFLEENPLPESDQNFTMGNGAYYFSSTQPKELSPKRKSSAELLCEANARVRSSAFLELSTSSSASMSTLTEKNDDHPLRVLSQECLTVVSTFPDSMSINGGELERFWPRFSLTEDTDLISERNHESGFCGDSHRLCKNLASLSQMSLTNSTCSPPCLYSNGFYQEDQPDILSLLPQNNNPNQLMSPKSNEKPTITTNSTQRPKSNASSTNTPSIKVPNPPTLSDESIFKIPISTALKKSNGILKSQRDTSESDQESLTIPAMKLIDITPIITNNSSRENVCSPPCLSPVPVPVKQVSAAPPIQRGCDHHHHINPAGIGLPKLNTSGSGGSSSGSSHQTLTPPTSPSIVTISPEILTKSPSKSKSRKIAKFFRTRSKSPKTAGATSSSESGKSSGSSSASAETKSSSGGSSYSSAPPPGLIQSSKSAKSSVNNNCSKSPKHSTPSKKNVIKNQNGALNQAPNTDYHFACDSVLPMFLPNPVSIEPDAGTGKQK